MLTNQQIIYKLNEINNHIKDLQFNLNNYKSNLFELNKNMNVLYTVKINKYQDMEIDKQSLILLIQKLIEETEIKIKNLQNKFNNTINQNNEQ